MKTLTIRGVEIGAGKPKIIVPIVGNTADEIAAKAREIAALPVDAVEWRADFFAGILDYDKTLAALAELRTALPDKILLFTFRTHREGGEREITAEQYTALNAAVSASGNTDLVDVEIFAGDDVARACIDAIHAGGAAVVGSNHDFHATPPEEELVRRLCKMQELGADILKIAVMPICKRDVLTLLAATYTMFEQHADRPLITMSMASTGVLSRLSGEVFGSSMTFGTVGQSSAPGQIPVDRLQQVLDILHDSV